MLEEKLHAPGGCLSSPSSQCFLVVVGRRLVTFGMRHLEPCKAFECRFMIPLTTRLFRNRMNPRSTFVLRSPTRIIVSHIKAVAACQFSLDRRVQEPYPRALVGRAGDNGVKPLANSRFHNSAVADFLSGRSTRSASVFLLRAASRKILQFVRTIG